MEDTPSHPIYYPEVLKYDALVTTLINQEDCYSSPFLFMLNINLKGTLCESIKIAYPFSNLLIPISQKTGIRAIILIKSKTDVMDFILAGENTIKTLKWKKFIFIPGWEDFPLMLEKKYSNLIEEVTYRTGKEILLLTGGKNGRS